MKKHICQMLVILSLSAFIGCEWDLGGDGNDWDDSWNWMNFSATYRGTGGNLVREFSSTGSGAGGGGGGGGGSGEEGTLVVITGEDGGPYGAGQTQIDGRLDEHPGIVPGSVTMVFESSWTVGTFRDDGGTGLYGTFAQQPNAPPDQNGSGTIEYDTGRWTLNLDSPGFPVGVTLTIDYTYLEAATNTVVEDQEDEDVEEAVTSIYSFTVTQSGNQLYFTDSRGDTYTGKAWAGSAPGGDFEGLTSGAVTLNFEVKGKSGGRSVTISGTFSGQWEAPSGDEEEGDLSAGNLTGRIIDGTWVENEGSADVRGAATSDSVGD